MSIRKELLDTIIQVSKTQPSRQELLELGAMTYTQLTRKLIKISFAQKYPIKNHSK